ncbi:3-oxoacyl-ACP reductase [Companilactobacillus sp. RD055328]|uniref:elongation factor P 5-aminopentanone reductase n=1 Tax=Companilactobacillus sp. RD055328 TaxID=2916634 RepID=UPI001FC890AC|nr:SDR family NAD(P)-dependent oxidoreductase [Companilactobacillus sp. RD055328]GKQ43070.1 3-oxoacyl-ACP reductase [Companilactobacillus sp. RD055328]
MNKKYALILGSSGDIGTDIAMKLADSGWSLYLHFHTGNTKITKLSQQLADKYPSQDFFMIQGDLINDDISVITDKIFALNAIIFAQGITEYGLFNQLSHERMSELMKVNYEKPLLLVQALQDKLASADFGRIVFVGSIYGKVGSAMEVMYSSLKAALNGFTNAYAKEVGGLGITVNTVAPGAVRTNMTADFTKEELQNIVEEIPARRMAEPKDISFWVDNLLKEEAEYMTGETIYVDGGWLL